MSLRDDARVDVPDGERAMASALISKWLAEHPNSVLAPNCQRPEPMTLGEWVESLAPERKERVLAEQAAFAQRTAGMGMFATPEQKKAEQARRAEPATKTWSQRDFDERAWRKADR